VRKLRPREVIKVLQHHTAQEFDSRAWVLICFIILSPSFWSASIFFLFICAYNAWVISPPCPHTLPYHPLHSLPLLPTPSIPGRNYFALISNFVEERVYAIIGRNKGFAG
jgi:hypothetical protein